MEFSPTLTVFVVKAALRVNGGRRWRRGVEGKGRRGRGKGEEGKGRERWKLEGGEEMVGE